MNTTRLIEAYLDGSLEKDQAEAIKARAEIDVEFAGLIRLHKEINESIRDNELDNLRRTLKRISAKKDISKRILLFPLRRILQIASIFLIIVFIGITFTKLILPGYSRSTIFEKFYEKYEPDVITRSGYPIKNSLENAQFQYQTGNYEECTQVLKEILRYEGQNYMALFYLGLSQIELQHPEEAINIFLKIPSNWKNPYVIHRNWYLSLCLIKTGHKEQAVTLLNSLSVDQGFYSQRAKKILDTISL